MRHVLFHRHMRGLSRSYDRSIRVLCSSPADFLRWGCRIVVHRLILAVPSSSSQSRFLPRCLDPFIRSSKDGSGLGSAPANLRVQRVVNASRGVLAPFESQTVSSGAWDRFATTPLFPDLCVFAHSLSLFPVRLLGRRVLGISRALSCAFGDCRDNRV